MESGSHSKILGEGFLKAEITKHSMWEAGEGPYSLLRNKKKATVAEAEWKEESGGNRVERWTLVVTGAALEKRCWLDLLFTPIIMSAEWRMGYRDTVQKQVEKSSWEATVIYMKVIREAPKRTVEVWMYFGEE